MVSSSWMYRQPGVVEGGDLVAVALGQVGEEHVEIGIRLDVDRRTPAAEVHHGRRRDRDLRCLRGHAGQIGEVVDLDVADVAQWARDRQAGRREVDGLGGVGARRDRPADLDAGKLFEEVEVEPGAPKLAVGDAAHADSLDLAHGVGDGLVLDRTLLAPR